MRARVRARVRVIHLANGPAVPFVGLARHRLALCEAAVAQLAAAVAVEDVHLALVRPVGRVVQLERHEGGHPFYSASAVLADS